MVEYETRNPALNARFRWKHNSNTARHVQAADKDILGITKSNQETATFEL